MSSNAIGPRAAVANRAAGESLGFARPILGPVCPNALEAKGRARRPRIHRFYYPFIDDRLFFAAGAPNWLQWLAQLFFSPQPLPMMLSRPYRRLRPSRHPRVRYAARAPPPEPNPAPPPAPLSPTGPQDED